MKTLSFLSLLMFANLALAKDESVNYEYKKYEKFDLGNLEIKGDVIAPGDLTVQERERKRFNRNLFNRKDFDDIAVKDYIHTR